ncbi:MAG: SMC-Scp complex subunit ScpB [Clostridia bacterium]|nr:SMC-Scp complex subunit ScpB [Clostridia bacterium]
MNKNRLISAVEAVLFAGGEPISLTRLCQIFDKTPQEIKTAIDGLESRLQDTGLQLVRMEDSYQLSSQKLYGDYIKIAFDLKRKQPLSQAAFEVLAVVAYNQPVTRAFIEQVRGVDCSGVVSTLVEKGLLEEKGRLELPGRPLLYGTTLQFLRCFSLKSLEDLPPLPEIKNDDGDVVVFDSVTQMKETATQLEMSVDRQE